MNKNPEYGTVAEVASLPVTTLEELVNRITPRYANGVKCNPISKADCADWNSLRARVLGAQAHQRDNGRISCLKAQISTLKADIAFVKRALGCCYGSIDSAIASMVVDGDKDAALGLIDGRDRLRALKYELTTLTLKI